MLGVPVSTPSSSPPPAVDHVRGLDAVPRAARALERFEPAVLLTADGLGAIYAPDAGGGDDRTFWFAADARTVLDWESHRRQIITLSYQSPDERVYLTLSGRAEVVTDPDVTAKVWRPTFRRWFPGGARDPRLLLVKFSAYDAEYYQTSSGRVSAYFAH
jgi:general stress protein 26